MAKIAVGCMTPNTIKATLDRFHAKMDNVKERVWDCTNKDVKTFVEKTVAKANLLVEQAESACAHKSAYKRLLPVTLPPIGPFRIVMAAQKAASPI
jgi:23S rRNA maturation-related 3'-5' exoribonuclease YhaM